MGSFIFKQSSLGGRLLRQNCYDLSQHFFLSKKISKRRVFHKSEKSFRFAKNNSCVTTVNLEKLPTLVDFPFKRPNREQSSPAWPPSPAELLRNFLTLDMICLLENLPEKVEFFKKVAKSFRFARNCYILGCTRNINIRSNAKKNHVRSQKFSKRRNQGSKGDHHGKKKNFRLAKI